MTILISIILGCIIGWLATGHIGGIYLGGLIGASVGWLAKGDWSPTEYFNGDGFFEALEKEKQLKVKEIIDENGSAVGFKYYKGEDEIQSPYTSTVETLSHYSSRGGIKVKDKEIVVSAGTTFGPQKISRRDVQEAYEIFMKLQDPEVNKKLTLIEQAELKKRAIDL
jgi:hypothetical protein